jgi:hypothetical protein
MKGYDFRCAGGYDRQLVYDPTKAVVGGGNSGGKAMRVLQGLMAENFG